MHKSEDRNRAALDLDAQACERLASGIILHATKDYRRALMARKRALAMPAATAVPAPEANWTIRECERFFRSPWFSTLSNGLEGDWIIRKIRAEVEG